MIDLWPCDRRSTRGHDREIGPCCSLVTCRISAHTVLLKRNVSPCERNELIHQWAMRQAMWRDITWLLDNTPWTSREIGHRPIIPCCVEFIHGGPCHFVKTIDSRGDKGT